MIAVLTTAIRAGAVIDTGDDPILPPLVKVNPFQVGCKPKSHSFWVSRSVLHSFARFIGFVLQHGGELSGMNLFSSLDFNILCLLSEIIKDSKHNKVITRQITLDRSPNDVPYTKSGNGKNTMGK